MQSPLPDLVGTGPLVHLLASRLDLTISSERQVRLWEIGDETPQKPLTIDQAAGVLMPFWSDNGILFLAGKGCVSFIPRFDILKQH